MKKRENNFILLLFVLATCIFYSCNTLKPLPPEVIISQKSMPKQPVSIIQIPLKINLAPFFKETNTSVPEKFIGNEQTCEGVSFSYTFLRDPIVFSGKNDKLWFDVNGEYGLRLNYCPQCTELFNEQGNCIIPRIYTSCGVDEPKRKIQISYSTNIQISENYKLVSKTKLENVNPLSPCEITVFNYDATKKLEEELTSALKEVEKDIDNEISSFDLRPQMEEAWNLLSEPIRLNDYGFISLNPKKISLSEIKYKGDTAYLNAVLESTPLVRTDTVKFSKNKLPSLSQYNKKSGFDISMDIVASYDSISSITTKKIKGMKVDIDGRDVIFGDVKVHGASDNSINLKVTFGGKKKGTLFLTGTPIFDTVNQRISFPDLTFDLRTQSVLLKSAKWLFNKKITNAIRESAEIEFGQYLDSLKTMLNENLNLELSDGIYLNGYVNNIYINYIHPGEKELSLRIRSIGKLEISM